MLTALAAAILLPLAGCAAFSPDGGYGGVAALTRERIGHGPSDQRRPEQAAQAEARIAELLREPLDAERAVELALLGHRELQARYAGLGIAEADQVRAGRLANPTLSLGRLAGGGAVEIDRALLFDVLGLVTLPVAREVARRQFEQAQLEAALDTVAVADEARQAFIEAVAARQLVGYFEQVMSAAEAAGDLARRMEAAGNFSTLAQLRERAFHIDAVTQLARARHRAVAAQERLVRALGRPGDGADLRLPERLPDLPDALVEPRDAEQTAMDRRLDVLAARRAAEATSAALGLTQVTRVVNVLHAGVQDRRATGEPQARGVEVELSLPLFDFGEARVARAEAVYRQALERTAAVAVQARSEVREAWSAYRSSHAVAKHFRDEVVPLRQRIAEENLLRYNGMLVSVFDLLVDAREQVGAVAAAVSALRDFWIADARLRIALVARSPGGAGPGGPSNLPAAAPAAGH